MLSLTDRQRRLLTAVLVLGTSCSRWSPSTRWPAIFCAFGDIILVFFLAWLLAFILSPLVGGLVRLIPVLPRIGAVVLVYAVLVGAIVLVVVLVAGALAQSISAFVAERPHPPPAAAGDPGPVAGAAACAGPRPGGSARPGSRASSTTWRPTPPSSPARSSSWRSRASAPLGNLLIVLILSLYMVVDRDAILSFFFRVVPAVLEGRGPPPGDERRPLVRRLPPRPGDPRRRLRRRGGAHERGPRAATTSPVTTAAAGVLMAIPFFGPFVAWAPPVIVALLVPGGPALPAAILMGIGWLIVMNVLQPRLMQEAVGHPPDRRPRLRPDREQDRRRHGRDLRHPHRRRAVGVLLPLPRP